MLHRARQCMIVRAILANDRWTGTDAAPSGRTPTAPDAAAHQLTCFACVNVIVVVVRLGRRGVARGSKALPGRESRAEVARGQNIDMRERGL